MIRILTFLIGFGVIMLSGVSYAQELYKGMVLDAETNQILPAVTIRNQRTGVESTTDKHGQFSITALKGDSISFHTIGYERYILSLSQHDNTVYLHAFTNKLEEITVNTGYYRLSKERASGSFVHVDQSLLNRSPSANIVDRIENLVTGFQIDRSNLSDEQGQQPNLRVRGVASINADSSPLIVLDGFPYDGNLNSIDPSSVESITFLKDAAASSIWGARAGNGVIVITSKSGVYGSKQQVQFSSSFQLEDRPDLFYSPNRLPSEIVLEMEDSLFERGIYPEADNTPIPYYIELKYALKNSEISKTYFDSERLRLGSTDFRKEAEKYLYRKASVLQQNLTMSGGGEMYNYAVLLGNSSRNGSIIGKRDNRLSIQVRNGLKFSEKLRTELTLAHVSGSAQDNGLSLSELYTYPIGIPSTYTRLMGEDGPDAIIKDYRWLFASQAEKSGLLDWTYRPLRDMELMDRRTSTGESRLLSAWTYAPVRGFTVVGSYQYMRYSTESNTHADRESYYVRDLVNRFTQEDGTLIIPHNGIMRLYGNAVRHSHAGRIQINYNSKIGKDHEITSLGGAELRVMNLRNLPTSEIYNYDDDLKTGTTNFDYTKWYNQRPIGSSAIPSGYPSVTEIQERFLSYYGNIGYAFRGRYSLTGSLRWDASNLFGVKANQLGIPLWSVGGRWDITKEGFADNWTLVDGLGLRGSFGSSGNVNQSASALPTVRRGTNTATQLPNATIVSVGNPSLRWERVNITNIGIDYSLFGNIVSGAVDMYVKSANDLLGYDYVDPTTGLSSSLQQMVNYAKLRTRGIDIQVNTQKNFGRFKWYTANLLSLVKNEVREHMTNVTLRATSYLNNNRQVPPVVGKSLDILYALPWHGLSSENGLPIVFLEGEESTEYNKVLNAFPTEDLLDMGSRIPLLQASARQSFSYREFEIGFLVSWKGNYVFRASSMAPGAETQGNGRHHMDYLKRWMETGDELATTVPANVERYDSNLDIIYSNSEILVERGDHIRLQDIRVSYGRQIGNQKRPVNFNATFFMNNVGVIWRANNKGIDPDYPRALYPNPTSYNLGINIQF